MAAVVIVCRRFVTQSTCGAAAERGSAVPRALVDEDEFAGAFLRLGDFAGVRWLKSLAWLEKGVVGLLARSFKGWRCPVSWFADDVFLDMI